MQHAPRPWRWPALLTALLLASLTAALAWLAWHATGRDALAALGRSVQTEGAVPLRAYVVEPTAVVPRATVVLLASLGRPASDFNALAQRLAEAGYRSVAVQSRGVQQWAGAGWWGPATLAGYADDVAAVLPAAGVAPHERVHVLGHAFGNRVARQFATQYPQRTASVVLVAAGDSTQLEPALERALARSVMGFVPWRWREAAVRQAFFAPGHAVPPEWQRGWSVWAALAQSRAARATPSAGYRHAGQAPVLVLQAQNDVVAPPGAAGERLRTELGERATLVSVPAAGHAFLPEQPEAIAQAVLRFWARQ